MASLTFGSLGDLMVLTGIVINIVKALSNAKGSARKYQSLTRELSSLSELLENLRTALDEGHELKYGNSLEGIIGNCKRHFEEFTKDINQFDGSLGQNPSDKSFKQIYQKLRWLTKTDDIIAFQRSIALYTSSIAGILALSGIDLVQRCQYLTQEQIEKNTAKLQYNIAELQTNQAINNAEMQTTIAAQGQELACIQRKHEEHQLEQALDCANILAAVKRNGRAIMLRGQAYCNLAQKNHKDISIRFNRLELALTTRQKRASNRDLTILKFDLLEENKILLGGIFIVLMQLAKLGVGSAYTLLHTLQCFLLRVSVPNQLQRRCMLFTDAMLRPFSIDVNFISFSRFIELVEDNFKGRPGARALLRKKYYIFEDTEQNELPLSDIWSTGVLQGKSIHMRMLFYHVGSEVFCYKCGHRLPSVSISLNREFKCSCGTLITCSTSITKKSANRDIKKMPPLMLHLLQTYWRLNLDLREPFSYFRRIRLVTKWTPSDDCRATQHTTK